MSEQGTRQKTAKPVASAASPWLPVPWELADVSALQALQAGTASPEMQRRALKWIIELAAGTYDLAYRPGGAEGARDTDFALGRQFVGQQIVKMLSINPGAIKRKEPRADAHDPTT